MSVGDKQITGNTHADHACTIEEDKTLVIVLTDMKQHTQVLVHLQLVANWFSSLPFSLIPYTIGPVSVA